MPRFSVVIPTHRRLPVLLRGLEALERQSLTDFEAVVVDDGSGDGTAAALRRLSLRFPLTVIEQENSGAAAARNAGLAAASGEIMLTLDDDMVPHPQMLAAHDRSHRDGADVVLGDIPIDPSSPRNMLSWGVGDWAERRRRRLTASGAEIRLDDLLTGQLSISRRAYEQVGGFDPAFTRDGSFGGEDIDFGHRLLEAGFTVVFNPDAVSFQYYDVGPADYLRRARDNGRADAELVRKHPSLAARMGASPRLRTRRSRFLLGRLIRAPRPCVLPLRGAAILLARSGRTGERARRLFFAVRTVEYLRGARGASC